MKEKDREREAKRKEEMEREREREKKRWRKRERTTADQHQLHLATCHDNIPNVSLMNYTYLAESPYAECPVIIMTTNVSSKKTNNLVANPNVSLLVHDCV